MRLLAAPGGVRGTLKVTAFTRIVSTGTRQFMEKVKAENNNTGRYLTQLKHISILRPPFLNAWSRALSLRGLLGILGVSYVKHTVMRYL